MAGVAAGSSFGRTEDTASPALGGDRVAKGFQFVVIDGDRFMPVAELRARVDTLIRDVHASAPAAGVDHVYVPGEIEHRTRERRLADGIPLSERCARDPRQDRGRRRGGAAPRPVPLGKG